MTGSNYRALGRAPRTRSTLARIFGRFGRGALAAALLAPLALGGIASTAAADTGGWTRAGGTVTGGGAYFGTFVNAGGQYAACALQGAKFGPGSTAGGSAVASVYTDPVEVDSLTDVSTYEGDPRPDVTGAAAQQIAYVMSKYGAAGGNEGAATDLAILRLGGTELPWMASEVGAANSARANQMIADAQANYGPYSVTKHTVFQDPNNVTVGAVNGAGLVTGGAGNVSGMPITYTVTRGSATFASNGTNTITINSGTSQSLPLTISGPDAIEVTATAVVPGGLMLMRPVNGTSQAQDTLLAGQTKQVSVAADPFVPVWTFQPEVSTQVVERLIQAGSSFEDQVTVSSDEWMIVNGAYVPVTAEGTLYGPFSTPQASADTVPAGAPVAGTKTLTFNGPGTQNAGGDIIAASTGYYAWTWSIIKANQPAENQQYIEGDDSDGFFTASESLIVQMQPSVTTVADTDYVSAGDAMVDNLTLAVEGDWLNGSDGNPVTIPVIATLYGPFDRPQAEQATVPAGAPVVGTETVNFTAEGEQATSGTLTAPAAGFYTWTTTIQGADAYTAFSSPFFEEVESASARHDLTITSMRAEYNVVPGGLAFDTITVSGFPEFHGDYVAPDGSKWQDDATVVTHTLYGPFPTAPTADTDLSTAKVVKSVETPAENGVYDIGWDREFLLTDPGHYVFVSSFAGDSVVAPITTSPGDLREQVYVPGAPVGEPLVVTQAVKSVQAGTPFYDTALVTGNVPDGSTISFAAYGPFERNADGTCAAPESIEAAGSPAFESGPHAYTQNGFYPSDDFVTEETGCYFWVETLTGPEGDILHQGEIGAPGETTTVTPREREITVTTQAQVDGDRKVGSDISDKVLVAGDIQEGDYTVVSLYKWDKDGAAICTTPVKSWTIALESGKTEYVTGTWTTTEGGTYGFVESTYDKSGTLLSKGACGEPSETVVIEPNPEQPTTPTPAAPTPAAPTQGAQVSRPLASTGAAVGVLGGIAAALAAAGAGVTIAVRRRNQVG